MSMNDYIRNYIYELFKDLYQERERQEEDYPEFVELIHFPTQAVQDMAASTLESSVAIREMARSLADFGKFTKTPGEVNIRIETSAIDARLSDDEWNNLMKNIGGKNANTQ